MVTDPLDFMSGGSAFHKRGADARKDLSPHDRFVLASWNWWLFPDRRPSLAHLFSCSRSAKYIGVLLVLSLNTMEIILYFILCLTGSQWRSIRTGVIWADTLDLVMRRAAEFWIFCSRLIWLSGSPFKVLLYMSSRDVTREWTACMLRGMWGQVVPNSTNVSNMVNTWTDAAWDLRLHRHFGIQC